MRSHLNCLISGDIVEPSFLQPIRLGVRVQGDRDEHPFSIQIQFRSFAATVAPGECLTTPFGMHSVWTMQTGDNREVTN